MAARNARLAASGSSAAMIAETTAMPSAPARTASAALRTSIPPIPTSGSMVCFANCEAIRADRRAGIRLSRGSGKRAVRHIVHEVPVDRAGLFRVVQRHAENGIFAENGPRRRPGESVWPT